MGANLSLEHCTLYSCNSYKTIGNSQTRIPVATIAQLAGGLTLKNCIVWDDVYPTDFPISGHVSQVSVHSSLIQGGMLGSISQNPVLNVKGYPTGQSVALQAAGEPSEWMFDIHKQPRSPITPSLGAVEWINSDAVATTASDSLPDWWEKWWFNHLTWIIHEGKKRG